MLVSGDFDAPLGVYSTRYQGFTHAHLIAGSGLHLTFLAELPAWGIDHTLGNAQIQFLEYRLLSLGFSDDLAQLSRVQLR